MGRFKFWTVVLMVMGLLIAGPASLLYAQEVTLRVGTQFAGQEWWEDKFAEFTARTGIKIETVNIPWGGEGLEKFMIETAAGTSYDVVLMSAQWLATVVGQGLALPLDSYVGVHNFPINDFYPTAVQALTYEGKLWAIPGYDVDVYLVYYNKDMFSQAGLGKPADNWSWADFLEVTRRTTRIDPAGERNQFGGGGLLWPAVAYSFGADIITDDGEFDLDQTHVIEGLQFAYDLRHVHRVFPRDSTEVGGVASLQDQFLQGYIATHWAGSWYARRITDFDWDLVLPPASEYGRATQAFFGGWFIPTVSKHSDAAWQLISFMHSDEVVIDHFRNFSAVPARASIATRPDIGLYSVFGERTTAALAGIPYGRSVPFHPLVDEIMSVIGEGLEPANAGEISVQLAMETIKPRVEAILERMK